MPALSQRIVRLERHEPRDAFARSVLRYHATRQLDDPVICQLADELGRIVAAEGEGDLTEILRRQIAQRVMEITGGG